MRLTPFVVTRPGRKISDYGSNRSVCEGCGCLNLGAAGPKVRPTANRLPERNQSGHHLAYGNDSDARQIADFRLESIVADGTIQGIIQYCQQKDL